MPLAPSSDSGSGDVVEQVSVFLRSLEDLSASFSKNTEALEAFALQQQTAQLQQTFPKLLQQLTETTTLEPAAHQRLRPYQTEAHRRLRLLSVEAMKLRTVKQPETLEKVRSQLQDHLTQLTKFIQAIADEIA
ncbi:MAG: heterocyst frequency control protein PatD [Cyanobacteria bacterium P01_F01_bin.53]